MILSKEFLEEQKEKVFTIKLDDLVDELEGAEKYYSYYEQTGDFLFLSFAYDELNHLKQNLVRFTSEEVKTLFAPMLYRYLDIWLNVASKWDGFN
jgi:hypothetical protein